MNLASSTVYFVCLLLLVACQTSSPAKKESVVYPAAQWETRNPESQGVDPEKLELAMAELAAFCRKDGLSQTLVIRNGYLIWEGDSTHKVHNVWSTSKSFTSTVLGMLIEQGKCQLDDFAHQWEPSLNVPPYDQITLRHFTTMTSGYNAEGSTRWDATSEDWSWTPYVPGEPLFSPGEHYAYWDEAQMMFGRVLTRIAGKSLQEVFLESVGQEIGFGDFEWGPEGEWSGIPLNNGCTNVMISPHQLARFGWLYLNDGKWQDKQVIPQAWVQAATQVQVPLPITTAATDRQDTDGSGAYGYNWWINAGQRTMPDSPQSLYYSSGFNNNMCFIVPEWNLVVVRMGTDGNPDEPKHIAYNRFFKQLGLAIQ